MDGGLALLENGSGNLDSPLLQFFHDARDDAGGDELAGNLPPPLAAAARNGRCPAIGASCLPCRRSPRCSPPGERRPRTAARGRSGAGRRRSVRGSAREGRSSPAIKTIVSSRAKASRGLLAWTVVMPPSWPVFMACSMSRASPLRTSPTMIRSGRIRRALTTRSRAVISPRPSMFGGRVSIRTTCSWSRISSAESSMVTIRSRSGMASARAPSKVDLPEPVPPEISTFLRPRTTASRKSWMSEENIPSCIRSLRRKRWRPKRRIDSVGASIVTGGSVALTRLPSGSRASTIGELSSIRRPTRAAIRWMIRTRWSASRKRTSVFSRRPNRSTYTCCGPVDEDIGDCRIGHQRRQRSDPQRLFQQVAHQPAAFVFVQRQVLDLQGLIDERLHEFGQRLLAGRQQVSPVEFVQQPLVQRPLDGKVFRAAGMRGRGRGGGRGDRPRRGRLLRGPHAAAGQGEVRLPGAVAASPAPARDDCSRGCFVHGESSSLGLGPVVQFLLDRLRRSPSAGCTAGQSGQTRPGRHVMASMSSTSRRKWRPQPKNRLGRNT